MRTNEQTAILLESKDISELLGRLYRLRKSENKKFSLQYLCNRAKAPSKGYLSDVITKRRRLNAKFSRGLADAFSLDPLEKKVFVLTSQKDSEPSLHRKQILTKQINGIKDQLKAGLDNVPNEIHAPILFTRIFCSLGIFSSPPNRNQVIALFTDHSPQLVNETIDALLKCGAIKESNEKLTITSSEVRFGNGNETEANLRYIIQNMDYAKSQLQSWFAKKDESYFEASTLSVKRNRYIESLQKIKEVFDSMLSELEESNDADELVHIGVQIFPDHLVRKRLISEK